MDPAVETAKKPAKKRMRTEGQRQLCHVSASSAAIGRQVGRTKAAVSAWRCGLSTPGADIQERLRELYGIPIEAWVLVPVGQPQHHEAAADNKPARGRSRDVAELARVARDAKALASDPELSAGVRAKALQVEIQARRELVRRTQISAPEIAQAPAFVEAIDRLCEVLQPHAEALRAVRELYERLLAEQPAEE
jgi:hypothetical protein